MTNLITISRVKNELDIVEPFIRHHVQLVDRMLVLDNGSSDGTYDILMSLKAEGLPIEVLRDTSVGHEQKPVMTRLMRDAVEHFQADWVLPIDVDEFIEPPAGLSLRQALSVQSPGVVSIGWSNFAWSPVCEASPEINPVARLVERLPRRDDHTKVLVPGEIVKMFGIEGVELCEGNHAVARNGDLLPQTPVWAIQLCHFPIRSMEQYVSKVAIGYLKYRADADRIVGHGFHYDAAFERLKAAGNLDPATVALQSQRYSALDGAVLDSRAERSPLRYAGGDLRYTRRNVRALANILHYAEFLAERLAVEIATSRKLQRVLDENAGQTGETAPAV